MTCLGTIIGMVAANPIASRPASQIEISRSRIRTYRAAPLAAMQSSASS